jgi:EAL and modified HD-GYP domain-containing signal transduction protein
VILKAILEIGLGKVAPERPVFINHTRDLLAMKPVLPPDRCVVEILEDVTADRETIQAVHRLNQVDYCMALDDFVFRTDLAPLLSRITYSPTITPWARVDFDSRWNVCARSESLLRPRPRRSRARQNSAGASPKAAGFYYLRKPELLGRRIPSNKLSVLSLLAECTNLETPASDRRHHRAGRFSPGRVTTTALTAIWKPHFSARMCELTAGFFGCATTDAYITGLLSTPDAVLNSRLEDLIAPLPVDNRFKRALLEREAVLGALLDSVTAYEAGNWQSGAPPALTPATLQNAFWDAAEYSRSMVAQILPP